MEYYVFNTAGKAQAAINDINANSAFPVTGKRRGKPAPDKQKTERWADEPLELKSGEFAVPRVPAIFMDELNIPTAARKGFLAKHGQDIRELSTDDFKQDGGLI
jgi:hypothetical protein